MTSIGATSGIRPVLDGAFRFDPGRDLRAVVELLQVGFQDELEAHDRRWLAELTALSGSSRALGLLFRFVPSASDSFTGFVQYADGRLIGNVTLLRHPGDAWVIANVVTAPDFRRRGIGRELVRLAIEEADRRGAHSAVLQVRRQNSAAIALYQTLGFEHRGATHTLSLQSPRLLPRPRSIRMPPPGLRSSMWRRSDDEAVRRLLSRAGVLDAPGPISMVQRELTRRGLRIRLDDWLKMRRVERTLVIEGLDVRAAGVAHVSERDVPHRVEFVIDPEATGRVEGVLVDAIIAKLRSAPERAIDALVQSDQPVLKERLESAGFRRGRTLERMILERGR